MGGPREELTSTRAFLESTMHLFSSYQHLLTNFVIEITGHEAQARTTCIRWCWTGPTTVRVCFLRPVVCR